MGVKVESKIRDELGPLVSAKHYIYGTTKGKENKL